MEAPLLAIAICERVDRERPDVAERRDRGPRGSHGEIELRALVRVERGRLEIDAEKPTSHVGDQAMRWMRDDRAVGSDRRTHAGVDEALAPRLEHERSAAREQSLEPGALLARRCADAVAAVATGAG